MHHSLRKIGVDVKTMVRAAMVPKMTYAMEVMGASSTLLKGQRGAAAIGAAPTASGKCVEAILTVADGPGGTVDPAHDAHAQPVYTWGLALWQNWARREHMEDAVTLTKLKLDGAKHMWGRVTGTTATMVASCWRVGWEKECRGNAGGGCHGCHSHLKPPQEIRLNSMQISH